MNNKELSPTVCLLPVSSINIHATGKIVRCQMSEHAMGDVADGSIIEQWDNEEFQTLRKNQREGTWTKGCENCKFKEEKNIVSKRKHWMELEIFDDLWDTVDWDNNLTNNEIYHMDIAFNNMCNFKCKMCSSAYSNAWIGDENKLKEKGIYYGSPDPERKFDVRISATYNREKWSISSEQLREVLDRAPHLRRLEILGGEPFLVPEFLEFLGMLRSRGMNKNIELMITTNGSLVTDEKLESLEGFKYVNINLSLDATGELFSYMRSAGAIDWDNIVKKAELIKNWCDRQTYGVYKLNINGAYQAFNALNIYEFIDFIVKFYGWDINEPTTRSKTRHSFEHRVLVGPTAYRAHWLPNEVLQESLDQINALYEKYPFLAVVWEKRYLNDIKTLLEETIKSQRNKDEENKYRTYCAKLITALDDIRSEDIKTIAPHVYESYKEQFDAQSK